MVNTIAKRMANLKGSVIREIVDAANKPGVISFANGNPSSETFPSHELATIAAQCLLENPDDVLQYGSSHGYVPLIETLKQRLHLKWNIDFTNNELTIVSGATQGCDIISKILLNEGDILITEEPSYASCFNIFRSYGAELQGVSAGMDGIDILALDNLLKKYPKTKLIYTIPTFANPTGATLNLEGRKKLYNLAQEHNVFILEDDPYSELRYDGKPVPPIKSLDADGRVFYIGSMSKTIAPSMRVGYIVYDKSYRESINIAKQITDVHTNLFAQHIIYRYITQYDYDAHIAQCCEIYRQRSTFMTRLLLQHIHPSVKISQAKGGLFLMLFLPNDYNSTLFVEKALDRGVACVPDTGFMISTTKPSNMVRICYSTATPDEIEKGIKILGNLSYELFNDKNVRCEK